MHVLLDTHVLLWWLADDLLLSQNQRLAILDKRNSCFISAVTIWEISIKSSLGKLEIADDYLDFVYTQGFMELPVSWEHARLVKVLPDFHKDPFDRMLIAQSQVEGMTLLSSDLNIARYDIALIN